MSTKQQPKPFNPFHLDDLLFTQLPQLVRSPLLVPAERVMGLDVLARGADSKKQAS